MPIGLGQSGTNTSTVISSDTTWTQANSPYNIEGNVLINNGTLTLATGTTLNLNGYMIVTGSLIIQQGVTINIQNASGYIQVDGILQALGTNSSPIHIIGSEATLPIMFNTTPYYSTITFSQESRGWNEQTLSGSIIENTIFSSTTLTISSSVKFTQDSFANALSIEGGTPVITGCTIESGLSILGGTPIISNNQVMGGITLEGSSAVFSNGQITYIDDNSISGQILYLESPLASNVVIERNLVTNSKDAAIDIAFANNVGCSMIINNNTITNSAVGIQLHYGYPQLISNNNIYDNTVNFKVDNNHSFNCTNNWWGTTDQQATGNSIYDFKYDFTLGTVNFVPFLTAPNPEAVPNINASITMLNPSPTPTVPEFPTLIILPLVALAILLSIVFVRKRNSVDRMPVIE
ncbi:MAG: right-handed parallel beta-helix repeat-containing protein [Candidatus Bathyarchaeia archaeon]|jgi:hypothetical protein